MRTLPEVSGHVVWWGRGIHLVTNVLLSVVRGLPLNPGALPQNKYSWSNMKTSKFIITKHFSNKTHPAHPARYLPQAVNWSVTDAQAS